ncbi:MAG: lysophospholipase [Actinomycetia bacterium]|nr:lysophospholipase [Actinomycetes bacterium]
MALDVFVAEPTTRPVGPPLLFVHGAWHGSWCWTENFTGFFSDQGYTSYAVDLSGHGNSEGNLARTLLSRYVSDVRRVALALDDEPVIIGHSMGGLVTQKYLARYGAAAGVLMASVPTRGAIGATLRIVRNHPMAFVRVNATFNLGPIVDDPARATDLLFGPDMAPKTATMFARRLQDESYLAYLEMIFDLPRPSLVHDPVLVLGAAEDQIFSVPEVAATARAYGSGATIFPRMGHDMMLEPGWRGPAQKILDWIESGYVLRVDRQ